MKNDSLLGHGMALLTIILWGTTFISTKVLLNNLSPIEILFYRFLIAYAVLWAIYPRVQKVDTRRDELLFFGAGCCGVTLYFLIENIALQYTLASNVGLLVSVAPMLTAVLSHAFTRDEKFRIDLIFGFVAAICGIFLVICNGKFVLKLNPLGDILAITAAAVWSVYSILLKKIGGKYNHIFITRRIFFYGLLTMLPLLYILKADFSMQKLLLPGMLPNILFLGFAASALCFVLWNSAVHRIGVVRTSSYIYLVPLITILTAVMVLEERITHLTAIGAVLILSGLYISEQGLKIIRIVQRVKAKQ